MVNAVYLPGPEMGFQFFIKYCGRRQVFAKRLFQDDLAFLRTTDHLKPFCDDAEKTGSHCIIKQVGPNLILPVIPVQGLVFA